MYLFLTGDSSSLSGWSPTENNAPIIVLTILFSFVIVVYLMNLFIGLLNMAIEKDNDRAFYLIQKAEILAEIELLYLLPFQRRWKRWFPEVIHYRARLDVARKYVKNVIEDKTWKSDQKYQNKVMKQLGLLDTEDYSIY